MKKENLTHFVSIVPRGTNEIEFVTEQTRYVVQRWSEIYHMWFNVSPTYADEKHAWNYLKKVMKRDLFSTFHILEFIAP